VWLLKQGVAAQHDATAFQEASRTSRREVVQQGAPWRLLRLWHHAALAFSLWRGGLCPVSPAR
jgi:hypothetical protein